MADEQTPSNDTSTQTAAPATQPGNGQTQITPEIQALIDQRAAEAAQQAKNAAWAEARRTFEAKQKPQGGQQPQPQHPQNSPAPSSPPDFAAQLAKHTAFTRAVGKFELSDEAFDLVQEEFARANPEDATGWVQKRAGAFGWKPLGASSPSTPAPSAAPSAAPTATPAAPSQSMPAGSAPSRVVTQDTRLVDMTPTERDAYTARHGASAFWSKLRSELSADQRRVPLRK